MTRTDYLSDLRQDATFAVRALGRQKAWTAITILTLALGIGATTAVFGVVSTFLLHPLSLPGAERIVRVEQTPAQAGPGATQMRLGPIDPTARAWFAYSRTVEVFGGFQQTPIAMRTATGDQSTVRGARILPNFFALAEEHPLIGRQFTRDDIANGGRVVLLGEGFWREHLAANPNVLGQGLILGDTAYTVIGVMPASFSLGDVGRLPTDLWLPLDDRDNGRGMALYARLRPSVTVEAATRELDAIAVRTGTANGVRGMRMKTLLVRPADETRLKSGLLLLAAAAGLVLLVACANVAHLLIARASARTRELAIRAALGADHSRLLRQLLTESFILTVAGTAVGVLVGWLGLMAIVAVRPAAYDELRASRIDGTTLAIAIAVAMVSGLVFGVIGSVQSRGQSTQDALKDGASSVSSSRAHWRMRAALVVTEMALSAMLVVGATMLLRSVTNLVSANLGFDPASLYSVYPYIPDARVPTPASYLALMTEMEARVRHIPGVREVTLAMVGPGSRVSDAARIEVDGIASPPGTAPSLFEKNFVQAGYFHTMGIALLAGTTFTDSSAASRQIIVDEAFARDHWGPSLAAALGHRVRLAQRDTEPWLTIVGVAHEAATAGPMYDTPAAMFYTPWNGDESAALIVRTTGDAMPVAHIRTLIRGMGVERAPAIDGTEAFLSRSTSEPRFMMAVLSIFTAIALMLASLGLYGVMAYTIAQQTREIGIRIALGATSARIASAVARRGAALAIAGAVAGLVAALWGTKVIEHELHGVSRLDVPSFVAGAVVLLGAAALACVVPTRRAIAIDPMSAIRTD